MLLRFAKEAAHEGHHDDHGHGHGSDHTPVVKEIGQERLTELYELVLYAIKGQMFYLYETGILGGLGQAVMDDCMTIAIEAANGELQNLAWLKKSGDPVLKTL